MGARLVKYQVYTKENEQIEAEIIVPEEKRCVIHGIVKNSIYIPIKDAVVKLFDGDETSDFYDMKPLTYTFTDEHGEFLFGPLSPNKNYVIKVWYNDINIKMLKLSEGSENEEPNIETLID